MNFYNWKIIFVLFAVCFSLPSAFSQPYTFRGQLSGWGKVNTIGDNEYSIGMRYLPEATASLFKLGPVRVDAEASANLFAVSDFTRKTTNSDNDAKLYRLWLRFSTHQFEARAGLQKINFGPAFILRSLMWFDSLDPRDPQQLTNGVYGVLLRYYFLNNANIWLWGLYGNDELKGSEISYTQKDVPEWGGRVQYPVGPGEAGVSFHRRKTDLTRTARSLYELPAFIELPGLWENRYALDGKWDVVLGLWFESSVTRYEEPIFEYQYINQLTLGADYTFGLGNGLHVTGEYLAMNVGQKFMIDGDYEYSALEVDYPVNLFNRVMGIVLYDHRNELFYWYGSVQQTFDHWSLNTMFFWSPEAGGAPLGRPMVQSLFRGIQIMVIYTH